jgi:two-component system, sensor histidine kinase
MSSPHRILIVDDSAEDREIYRRLILRDIGGDYVVEESDCGTAGLRICRNAAPDCVLLDYFLPDINGLEFLTALGRGDDETEIPVVFLTGRGNEAVAVRALKQGAHDYLVKSAVTAECMRHALRGAIEGSRLRRQIERQRADLAEQAEALKEADRRKDEFLAMLAHELRNPLAPIRNMTAVLRRAPIDDPIVKTACAVIERQVAQMTHITDDLLDVSRIVRGGLQLRKETCDLTAIAREAVEDARDDMERARLRLLPLLPDQPLMVQGDRHRLSQALHNLLHNARKFTPADGSVTVALAEESGWAELVVEDTGVGVADDLLPHVFDAFRQGPQTLDRSAGGLGLGLALVKGVIELHGGDVTAANREDHGAVFSLRLPLDDASADLMEGAVVPQPRARRVLLVEDDVDVAESTRLLLETMGHDVRLATRGEDALRLAHDYKPDVVLCDIGLPGAIDGFGVARGLREDPGLTDACLVAVSGYGHTEIVERARAAGFVQHLTKPIGEEGLARLLAETP